MAAPAPAPQCAKAVLIASVSASPAPESTLPSNGPKTATKVKRRTSCKQADPTPCRMVGKTGRCGLCSPRSDAERAKRRAAMKAAMTRPEVKAKRKAALNRPEVKARHKAAVKASWADPGVKARRKAAMKAALNRPEIKAKHKAAMKASWADPEVKARRKAAISVGQKAAHQRKLDAWCPVDRQNEYRELVLALSAKEAREIIEASLAREGA